MARLLGDRLPPDLLAILQGGALYRDGGKGVAVLTVDAQGLPHCAIVSCAVCEGDGAVWVPIGAGTTTARNLERDGRCTLVLADAGLICYIKGAAAVAVPAMACFAPMAAARLAVSSVYDDGERAFAMTGGLTYRFVQEPEALAELERRILDELVLLAAERGR